MSKKGYGLITRSSSINPPSVRKILKSIGNEKVVSLKLVRTPLSNLTKSLLNIASFGKLDEKLKSENIDKLFHLSLLINDKYTLEKNEVIKLERSKPNLDKSETLNIPVPPDSNLTINQLLENTQKRMGDKYGSYDAVSNNCSVFVDNVLQANNLQTSNGTIFLSQKVDELFKKFPSLTRFITNIATTLGAVANRQIEGEGQVQDQNMIFSQIRV